jgi:cell division septal protein FtsQ
VTYRPRPRSRASVGQARRTRPIRRASAGLSPIRAGAALAMLVSAGAIYGATASAAFDVRSTDLGGIRFSDRGAVEERLALPAGANVFTLSTEPLESRLLELPTIARAAVSVRLPGTLVVEIGEREPLLVWRVGDAAFLVDADGTLFAELGPRPTADAETLPVVDDQRKASAALAVGKRLDPVDLDAATRLASLRPTDVGSAGGDLRLSVSDPSGFVVRGGAGWAAIFGFYTPSLRTPEIIPGQVRLLRSLLVEQGERNVARIVLASETDGTFTTPAPSPTASP